MQVVRAVVVLLGVVRVRVAKAGIVRAELFSVHLKIWGRAISAQFPIFFSSIYEEKTMKHAIS